LTTAEGYACGTPAIVYNATASPELVTPETGRVVEPGDIQGVLSAVMEIKEKGKSWYAAACRKRAETWYDKNKNFKQYISLYDSLLTKKV
jgi:glycosyltransferase involved in cell wall biosynthesis